MADLWLRFSDETSLPAALTPAEQKKLTEIYDAVEEASVWNLAAAALGLPRAGGQLLSWRGAVPYVNWSLMTAIISCGAMGVAPLAEPPFFAYVPRATLMRMPALLKSQWRAALYIERRLGAPVPEDTRERIVESTTLGLALQALLLRLPKHAPRDLAAWLADPAQAPAKIRRTILQMRAVQKRRTELSSAWAELFPPRAEAAEQEAPSLFWTGDGAPPPAPQAAEAPKTAMPPGEFTGLPVSAGLVAGRGLPVVSLRNFTPPAGGEPPILVFARARPETVEFFPRARAVLFAEGGALSHACTVAREQGLPCVTGLGQEFWGLVRELADKNREFQLAVDGAAGTVQIVTKGAA
jgi:phosphohistidine swiveling domain-containing protein